MKKIALRIALIAAVIFGAGLFTACRTTQELMPLNSVETVDTVNGFQLLKFNILGTTESFVARPSNVYVQQDPSFAGTYVILRERSGLLSPQKGRLVTILVRTQQECAPWNNLLVELRKREKVALMPRDVLPPELEQSGSKLPINGRKYGDPEGLESR